MLYHGTTAGGLSVILANSKSHTSGKSVAYFTGDRCYAPACCRGRSENFVTIGLGRDGNSIIMRDSPISLPYSTAGSRDTFT